MKKRTQNVSFTVLPGCRFRCKQTGKILASVEAKDSYKALLMQMGIDFKPGRKAPFNLQPKPISSRERKKVYPCSDTVSSGSTVRCPKCTSYTVRVGDSTGIFKCANGHRVRVTVEDRRMRSFLSGF